MYQADENKDGTIDFKEFCALMYALNPSESGQGGRRAKALARKEAKATMEAEMAKHEEMKVNLNINSKS